MDQQVDIVFLNGTSSAGKTTVAEAVRSKAVWQIGTRDYSFCPQDVTYLTR